MQIRVCKKFPTSTKFINNFKPGETLHKPIPTPEASLKPNTTVYPNPIQLMNNNGANFGGTEFVKQYYDAKQSTYNIKFP